LGLPQQRMAKNINAVHQMVFSGGYRLPNTLSFLSVGAEMGFGSYANKRVPTTFQIGNGAPTSTHVNYSSNTFNANSFVNIDISRNFPITPYITVKGGVHRFYSSIVVEDPNDEDGCRPLERESIIKDNTASLTYGVGLRYEIGKYGYGRCNKTQYIDLQILRTQGGTIDYINTKKLNDHSNHVATNTANTANDDYEAKPLKMKFINVQSNVVHNHMVAEVFSTSLRLLDIRLGYYITF
jgi:hypothetical protein